MSLFPRFTQEFAPLFRLMDDYDRRAFPGQLQEARSFTPKFDVKEKDINIEWSDANTLTISGRHEHVREEGERLQALIEDANKENEKHYEKPSVEDETTTIESAKPVAENQVAKKGEQGVAKKSEKWSKFWVSERSVGEFHRSFSFPARVDQDAVKASLKNGILSVVVPKAEAMQLRKISIE